MASATTQVLPFYLTRISWRETTSSVLERSLLALSNFSASPLNAACQADVAEAIGQLRQIDRDLRTYSPRRPYLSNLQANRNAAECLVRMADFYIEALGAGLPSEAQALGKRAQVEIDAATGYMDDAEREQEIGDELGAADPKNFVTAALGALAAVHPSRTFMEVDALRQRQLSRDLGREVATGQGAAYEIALVIARSTLDVDRFEKVVSEASRLLDSPARIREIAAEPGALTILLRARNAIVESTAACATAVAASTTDDGRLARTINLYRELFEYAGLPLFAWFLRAVGAKSAPLSKLMLEDSTRLLDLIGKRPELASLFLGADKNIRTAASHGHGYELVGDDVVINTRSFEGTMTVEVVIDLLLALIESLLAAFWVIDNELTVLGIEGHTSADSLVGASMLVVAEEVLKHLGATVLSGTVTEVGWQFEIAEGAASLPHVYAEGLASNPPSDVHEISIISTDLPAGELRIPRAASARFRESRDGSPMALLLANLDLLQQSSLDGRTAVTEQHLQWTACVASVSLLSEDNTEAIRVLRHCLKLARELGADDVVHFVDEATTQWRVPDERRLMRLRQTMKAWTALAAPTQPLVRVTTLTALHAEAGV
jgi:hypothetical protein